MSSASSTDATRAAPRASAAARLRDYAALAKPEISFLVMIEAGAGFLLAPVPVDLVTLAATLAGVFLCAGGAGVLNHYIERELDATMKRTRRRALPDGRIAPKTARTYGFVLIAAGVALLCPLAGPLTAVLALGAAALYVLVYTPLKRKTKYNTLVGTVPGALPALGGWAAATGSLGAGGWALFALLAAWQMPHFLSLGWMYRNDYGRGGFRMLSTLDIDASGDATARQMIGFTALLLALSTLPFVLDLAGWVYLSGALVLGGWFLYAALRFARRRTGLRARYVLNVSIYYVPLLTALIVLERFV